MRRIDLNSGRHLEIMLLLHYNLFLLFHIKHGIGDVITAQLPNLLQRSTQYPLFAVSYPTLKDIVI